MIKRILMMCVGAALIGLGAALTIKVDIGVSPIDAFNMSLSSLTFIKVGTISTIVNSMFILLQWIVLKKDFEIRRLAQFILAFLIGNIINFFYYVIFASMNIDHYWLRFLLFVIAEGIIAFGCAFTIQSNLISSPIETFAEVVAKTKHFPVGKCRQAIDIFALLGAFVLFFVFHGQLYLREGTILSVIIFGPIFGYAMKIMNKGRW